MMLPNTPSAMIASEMVKHDHHGIFFVGYLDHETLGYHLLHASPGDELQFGLGMKPVKVKLENIKRFHFSAHAPRQKLREVVDRIQPKNVVYVHGDPDAIAWMKDHAPEGCKSFAPTIGQTITLEA
jgi:predicted metal-dependent RNase